MSSLVSPTRLADLVYAIVTNPTLLKHVVSFQDGFPVAFAPALRTYFKSGFRLKSLCPGSVIYADVPRGRQLRLAHAIGYSNDMKAADLLLRLWRDTEHADLIHEVDNTLLFCDPFPMKTWLLTHRSAIPGLTDTLLAEWIHQAPFRDAVDVLALMDKHLGIQFIREAIDDDFFKWIARCNSTNMLHWLARRGIYASSQVIANIAVPAAIIAGQKTVIEYFLKTTTFQLDQINPKVVATAIWNAKLFATNRDHEDTKVITWAVIEHRMPFTVDVVRSLIYIGHFKSAEFLISHRTSATPPLPTTILTPAFAKDLLDDRDGIEAIGFVLLHFGREELLILSEAIRPSHLVAMETTATMRARVRSTSAAQL